EPEEGVKLTHPLRVALSQVVVHGHNVNSLSSKGVQINGESGDQRFTFTGLHFRDLALMQHRPADQLYVEVTHVEHAPSSFANHRKRLRENFIQGVFQYWITLCLAGCGLYSLVIHVVGSSALHGLADTLAELVCLGPKLRIRELLHPRLKGVNLRNKGPQALHLALVLSPDNLGDDGSDQKLVPLSRRAEAGTQIRCPGDGALSVEIHGKA